jgi:nucleotide-binding universal stress UspA family protein
MSILAATDLSTRSIEALQFAERMGEALDVPVRVLHAAPVDSDTMKDAARQAFEEFLNENASDPGSLEQHLAFGDPVDLIKQAAAGCELVVCGATGASYLQEVFLGSTASRLLRESPAPVCIVPDGFDEAVESIVIPVAFDKSSREGLRLGAKIARAVDAQVCLLYALDLRMPTYAPEPSDDDITRMIEEARGRLEKWADEEGIGDLAVSFEVWGHEAAESIREVVTKFDADLIVMGTHGRGQESRYFLGSVAERVVRQPPCPVIVTRPSE